MIRLYESDPELGAVYVDDNGDVLDDEYIIYVDGVPYLNEDLLNKEIADKLLDRLRLVADQKTVESERYINQEPVTDKQIQRYKYKYDMALKAKQDPVYKSQFEYEAQTQDITVDQLIDIIISKGKIYTDMINEFTMLIEAVRVKVKKMIKNNEFKRAEHIIEIAEKTPPYELKNKVKKLFEE